jgi:hypothetical protein
MANIIQRSDGMIEINDSKYSFKKICLLKALNSSIRKIAMLIKNFKQVSSFKLKRPNENVTFFLNQAIEWHEEGFTAAEMAEMMFKYQLYSGKGYEHIRSSIYKMAERYCNEFDDRKSIVEPKKSKRFRLKSDFF